MKIIILICILFPQLSFGYLTNLSDKDLSDLRAGEILIRKEDVKGETFPKVTLIQVIPHSPQSNMKAFTDYTNHKNFIPNILVSKIIKENGNIADVYFEMKLPIISDIYKYTTRHEILIKGQAAILNWKLIESKQIKASEGSLIFEEFEGKTLFTYTSHTTPKSSFAWFVKRKVVPELIIVIKAITQHLEKTAK